MLAWLITAAWYHVPAWHAFGHGPSLHALHLFAASHVKPNIWDWP